jgi:hypothetical protein
MVASTHRVTKGASPLCSDTRGDLAEGGAVVSALGLISQREITAQKRARFGRGDSALHRPFSST